MPVSRNGFTFGLRAHDHAHGTPDEVFARIAETGAACLQLAPSKVFVPPFDRETDWAEASVSRLSAALNRNGLSVAVLGCYVNWVPDDADRFKETIRRFIRNIEIASVLGAGCVGTETCTPSFDQPAHPDTRSKSSYLKFLSGLEPILGAAERSGVDVGIEPVVSHVIWSPEILENVIRDMNSPRLKVILDPVNLLSVENHESRNDLVKESLDRFGPQIRALHVKDYRVNDSRKSEAQPGQGFTDWAAILKILKPLKPFAAGGVPCLIESCPPAELDGVLGYLKTCI